MTGILSHFLPFPDSTLPSLHHLNLAYAGLNKDDVNHLKTLIESHNIPALGGQKLTDGVSLDGNNLVEMVVELEGFLNSCLKEHQKELRIGLWHNNLSDEFKAKWIKRCEGSHVKLFF